MGRTHCTGFASCCTEHDNVLLDRNCDRWEVDRCMVEEDSSGLGLCTNWPSARFARNENSESFDQKDDRFEGRVCAVHL